MQNLLFAKSKRKKESLHFNIYVNIFITNSVTAAKISEKDHANVHNNEGIWKFTVRFQIKLYSGMEIKFQHTDKIINT